VEPIALEERLLEEEESKETPSGVREREPMYKEIKRS